MDITTVTRKEQEAPAQGFGLKLFITGSRPESARVVARLRAILQDYDLHASSVQIVDIEQAPQVAKEAQVIGAPALVREYPPPRKSVIGDLSDATVVLQALDIPITKKRYTASVAESPQEPLILREAGREGAAGYIFLKDVVPEELLQSIHRVVEGGTQMTTTLLRAAVDNLIENGRKTLAERTAEVAHLTKRETDVLRLLGNGDSNKIIAETLGITLDTTKKHVRNVIDKLQARNRTHAAIIAAQAGLVGNPISPVVEAKSEPGSVA